MRSLPSLAFLLLLALPGSQLRADAVAAADIQTAMKKAATFFRTKAATRGGYVYYYSPDLTRRLGEGAATAQQIWVQRPGTPAVGLAYLRAFEATRDPFYLEAATEAAEALVYGQLESGGWTNAIDFDPKGNKVGQYRGGRGRGRNYSTLDDGISQHALRLIMKVDRALQFKHAAIHEASEYGRQALLAAQFPSGGFPQVWAGPVAARPPVKAAFPTYDWKRENRIKEYWDLPTLNDDLAGNVAAALIDAWEIYRDERCQRALAKLGDFLLLAQLPEPQPAWAQQYDFEMRPVWARKFEPPAIASRESQDAMETLQRIARFTGQPKYLAPIPRALEYLRQAQLRDGRLARYYELGSNRPLYMTRDYALTYDDSDLPEHYGWKVESRLDAIAAAQKNPPPPPAPPTSAQVQEIVRALDPEGRWLSDNTGQPLVGQPKFKPGESFVASEVFCRNLEALSDYLLATSRR